MPNVGADSGQTITEHGPSMPPPTPSARASLQVPVPAASQGEVKVSGYDFSLSDIRCDLLGEVAFYI